MCGGTRIYAPYWKVIFITQKQFEECVKSVEKAARAAARSGRFDCPLVTRCDEQSRHCDGCSLSFAVDIFGMSTDWLRLGTAGVLGELQRGELCREVLLP